MTEPGLLIASISNSLKFGAAGFVGCVVVLLCIERSYLGLDPDKAIAKAVEGYVAVSSRRLRFEVEEWEGCVKPMTGTIMVDRYVFASGEGFPIEVFNCHRVGGRFVSCVDCWLVWHSYASNSLSGKREKMKTEFP